MLRREVQLCLRREVLVGAWAQVGRASSVIGDSFARLLLEGAEGHAVLAIKLETSEDGHEASSKIVEASNGSTMWMRITFSDSSCPNPESTSCSQRELGRPKSARKSSASSKKTPMRIPIESIKWGFDADLRIVWRFTKSYSPTRAGFDDGPEERWSNRSLVSKAAAFASTRKRSGGNRIEGRRNVRRRRNNVCRSWNNRAGLVERFKVRRILTKRVGLWRRRLKEDRQNAPGVWR